MVLDDLIEATTMGTKAASDALSPSRAGSTLPGDGQPDLSLRDQLACAALAGLAAPLLSRQRERRRVALLAYAWADEMLAARAMTADELARALEP